MVTCYASGLFLCLLSYAMYVVVLGCGKMVPFMYASRLVTCRAMVHVFFLPFYDVLIAVSFFGWVTSVADVDFA